MFSSDGTSDYAQNSLETSVNNEKTSNQVLKVSFFIDLTFTKFDHTRHSTSRNSYYPAIFVQFSLKKKLHFPKKNVALQKDRIPRRSKKNSIYLPASQLLSTNWALNRESRICRNANCSKN